MFTKAFALIAIIATITHAQTSFFTYQGTLNDAGAPANGLYDIQFWLYDDIAPGPPDNLLGSYTLVGVEVTEGLFSVELSFGYTSINSYDNLYIELLVRPNGPDPFTTLAPRQEITSTPRAIRSLFAGQALSLALPFYGTAPGDNFTNVTFDITNSGGAGYGIRGQGPTAGILGRSTLPIGAYPGFLSGGGIVGISSAAGVQGVSDDGYGIAGWSSTGTGGYFQTRGTLTNQYALRAESTRGSTAGLFEVRDLNNLGLPALIAKTDSTLSNTYAIHGIIESTTPGSFSAAVRGENKGTGGNGIGVYGSHDGSGWGVYGTSVSGFAGVFQGRVHVNGTLSKAGGSFKIDHPQDPENMTLSHSFVESPDMKNIYDGVIILDKQGQAIVTLPSYFNALNQTFRYQLTTIGGYAPVYIAAEIESSNDANSFAIAGGTPNLKVSWQVTGIRQDAWANKNRIPIEEYKEPKDQGKYLNPAAFNQPKEKGINYIQSP